MSATIPQVYVNTYESTVRHLAQQGITRLRPWVMERSVQSEAHNWERIAATAATQKTARKVATPDDETEWSRRVSVPQTWHTGDVTEQEDIVQMIIDPNSNYARAQGMAMRRAHDDAIIAAATGTALDGDGATNALPAGQVVGDNTGQISYDMVTEVTEKFMANDIDPDEEKVFVIGPKQARKLLQLTEATSGDYNALKPLTSKGYIESWMGYSWVVSTRLLAPAADQLTCFAMTRKALGLQMNKDISAKIEMDPSISFAWRIYCHSTFGAIRVEDEHIVGVEVADTV
jgi:alkylated DNA nucleotide flippase Atl1